MYVPSVAHLKLINATLHASTAYDEYRYIDNIALRWKASILQLNLQWIKVIQCMKLVSVWAGNNSPSLFMRWYNSLHV